MTLEKAIKHCYEKAEELRHKAYDEGTAEDRINCLDCAEEHEQLAEWLEELKEWRSLKLVCGFDEYVIYKEKRQ